MADRTTAYTALASQGCDTDYGGVTTELAGKTLVPGVYCSTSFHLSSGTLTLNGAASAVWIFKSASDLIITGGASSKVVFIGGGQPCNVWWRVVSTATFDANSTLVGNILADTSITFAAGASLDGRALARTAAVTLSSNSITGPTCGAGAEAGGGVGISGVAAGSSSSSSSSSNGSSSTVCPTLNYVAPIIIDSKRISPTSISINWGPYSGTDKFIVRYGLTNGNWLYSTKVTGFSTIINALPINQPIWIQVAARNDCSVGNYGTAKLAGGPSLPNTGFAPAPLRREASENNIPWNIPVGIFVGISALLVLIQRKHRFLSGH